MKRGRPFEPGQLVRFAPGADSRDETMTVVKDHGRRSVLVRMADGTTELHERGDLAALGEAEGA